VNKILLLTAVAAIMLAPTSQFAQSKPKKNKKTEAAVTPPVEKKPEVTIKEYGKVITKDAISDSGLFTVSQGGQEIFF